MIHKPTEGNFYVTHFCVNLYENITKISFLRSTACRKTTPNIILARRTLCSVKYANGKRKGGGRVGDLRERVVPELLSIKGISNESNPVQYSIVMTQWTLCILQSCRPKKNYKMIQLIAKVRIPNFFLIRDRVIGTVWNWNGRRGGQEF